MALRVTANNGAIEHDERGSINGYEAAVRCRNRNPFVL